MGLVHKPAPHFYWSTDKIFQTPVFNTVMSRNRFNLLLKFFHINDNQNLQNPNDPNRDRLYKLRPVIEKLFEKFQSVYTPNQCIAVDESLLLWKGRLLFKQYLPLKRARFGIKLFCLCEDSGYMYRFRIYTGKQSPTDAIDIQLPEECKSFNTTEKIVVYMMLPLLNKGYTIWMDNWYSSCRLFHFLHHYGTTACGTIRSNRIPLVVKNANVLNNETAAFCFGPLLCLKYKDKKDVYMLSSQHDETVSPVKRRRGRPPFLVNTKPRCIVEYNYNMGSVDKHDQMLKPYSIAKKIDFIRERENGDAPSRLKDRHFPDTLVPTATWKKPQARCRVCSRKGVRRDIKTICPLCPGKPGLCASPCFKLWHTEIEYGD
ncbi:piggyBac transposable element-derived protein 4-like [Hydra vulgaris]|uniref:PiggyBac transposable element-derived protein 4-like n=1 Tax=Hydra vulgaris TaxID=6087 RepID=A0ABM4CRZ0_HYDVU